MQRIVHRGRGGGRSGRSGWRGGSGRWRGGSRRRRGGSRRRRNDAGNLGNVVLEQQHLALGLFEISLGANLKRRSWWLSCLLAIAVPAVIYAADLTLPHVFTVGTPILASEVNANFEAVRLAVNSNGSGTRLKVLALKGNDGFSQLITGLGLFFPIVWDSQLHISCNVLFGYCGPLRSLQNIYSDAACTAPVFRTQSTQSPMLTVAVLASYFGSDAGTAFNEPVRYAWRTPTNSIATEFYRLGPEQIGTQFQSNQQIGADGGLQLTCSNVGNGTFEPVIGIEPEANFARVSFLVQ